eukprot:TRINITY_DN17137_c0_g1_i1.p1 TRINITY_DN17137_c0_g1~~TRINITY_DN17137_c0_g1_i1.p1  ORF type:complete len:267 (+),score=89.56 TRINITY_DN17137_c0_g1_i1:39-803(+)
MGAAGSGPACTGEPANPEPSLALDEPRLVTEDASLQGEKLSSPAVTWSLADQAQPAAGTGKEAVPEMEVEPSKEAEADTGEAMQGKNSEPATSATIEDFKASEPEKSSDKQSNHEELEIAAKQHLIKKAAAKKAAAKKAAAKKAPMKATADTQKPDKPSPEANLTGKLTGGCKCNPSNALLPGQKKAVPGEKRCPLARMTQEEVDAEFVEVDPANDPLQHLSEEKRQEIIARAKKRAAGYEKLGKTMEQECHQQ